MSNPALLGHVQVLPLANVQPNGWNPNRVPDHIMRSIEHGFRTDGWVVSQALLVWGKDERGVPRNLIIDGEHRWKAGLAVGLKDGPMVVLDGLTEAAVKAWTIKLNQKRGAWDEGAVAKVLQEIQYDVVTDAGLALDLGFDEGVLARHLAFDPVVLDAPMVPERPALVVGDATAAPQPGAPAQAIRVVQLVYNQDEHAEFVRLVKQHDQESVALVVLKALRALGE